MREVDIPGGKAYFREPDVDPFPGNSKKLMKAAYRAAFSQLGEEYPELFTPAPAGETEEQRVKREAHEATIRMRLSIDQARSMEEIQEAAVVAGLHHWTLDLPLPTFATLGEDKYAELYDALLEAVQEQPEHELEIDFGPNPVGETPTSGFDASSMPSRDEAPNPSTTILSADGTLISGESSSPEQ